MNWKKLCMSLDQRSLDMVSQISELPNQNLGKDLGVSSIFLKGKMLKASFSGHFSLSNSYQI